MAIKNHFRDGGRLGERSAIRRLGHGSRCFHGAVLDSDGLAWMWGSQPLGDGDLDNQPASKSYPTLVIGSLSFVQIASGTTFTVARMADGSMWTWGGGANSLGRGPTPAGASVPGSVLGNHSFVTMACGAQFTLALKADGTIWSWGDNNGQFGGGALGNETSGVGANSPISVHGDHSFVAVAAGGDETAMALKADGSVWTWGSGTFGLLGNGDSSNESKSSPISVVGNHSFISISMGAAALGLKADGSIWGWGVNTGIGNDSIGPFANPNSPVWTVGTGRLHSFVEIAAGENHALARKADGTVWAWGRNASGQVGNNSITISSFPVAVFGNASFNRIDGGANHSAAVRADGVAFTWGEGGAGQCGNNGFADHSFPDAIYMNLKQHSFVNAFGALNSSIALKSDGTAWAFGQNADGRLGINTNTTASSPASVAGGQSYVAAAGGGGGGHWLFLQANGAVWSSGENGSGELGTGGSAFRSSPVLVVGTHKFFSFIEVSSGTFTGAHTVALQADGVAWSWGRNLYGELGNGTHSTSGLQQTPVSAIGAHSFVHVAAGGDFSVAIKVDGTCWAWGINQNGQLGDGTIIERHSPTSVVGGHSFVQIAAGSRRTMALKADGTVWGWGLNSDVAIGDNTATDKSSPTSVVGNHSFVAIVACDNHSMGLKADGTAWAWGQDGLGQLGDNLTTARSSPVSVAGAHSFVAIAVCDTGSAAIKADGSAWTWGNGASQGDGTSTNRSSPVSVLGGHSFTRIGGGMQASAFVAGKADGTSWAWGLQTNFQLGDGTNVARQSPVSVIGTGFSFGSSVGNNTYHLKLDGSAYFVGSNADGQMGVDSVAVFSTIIAVYGTFSGVSFNRVSAGDFHSVGLASDGTAWAWGRNSEGELGDGTVSNKSSPASVVGNHSFVQVTTVANATAGLKADGTVWAWGENNLGQLGDGTVSNKSSPTSVLGGFSFTKIAGGAEGNHMLGLRQDGTIWSWGFGTLGQLGNGVAANRSSPVSVVGASFNDVFAGQNFSMATKSSGGLFTWGDNSVGQLMTGVLGSNSTAPIPALLSFATNVVGGNHGLGIDPLGRLFGWGSNNQGQIGDNDADNLVADRGSPVLSVGADRFFSFSQVSAGGLHSLALSTDGSAWAFGQGTEGQLGNGIPNNRSSPISVVGAHSFASLYAGGLHSMGLKADGTAWTWGYNFYGQLGLNHRFDTSIPTSVVGAHSFVALAAALNGNHSMGLKSDGTVWTWGQNNVGQLGDMTLSDRSSPTFVGSVPQQNPLARISVGGFHAVGLRPDGSAVAWGENSNGQLGNNSTTSSSIPTNVVGGHSFSSVSAGGGHSLGLKADGTVWAWGLNSTGQVGNATLSNKSSPTSVVGAHSFSQASAGNNHSVAIKANNGTAWAWGDNYDGRLGDNTTVFKSSPTSVVGAHSFIKVAAGHAHTVALKADGTAWAWGSNGDGGLGDGTYTLRSSPVSVVGAHSFVAIAAGFGASAGLKSDGSVWTWGNGDMLGDGTVLDKASPVSVVGNHTFSAIKASNSSDHFVALKADGTAWAWGVGTSGQLGGATSKSSPTSVVGGKSFVDIAAGGSASAAVMADNSGWAWGSNSSGQLGDGTTANRSSPTSVFHTANASSFTHLFYKISAGSNHSMGLKADGTAWAWGSNGDWQLGDGTILDRSSPTSVIGGNSFVDVAAGGLHSVAMKSTGEVLTFGWNGFGNLGLAVGADSNDIQFSTSPTYVLGTKLGLVFKSITAGGGNGGSPHSAGLLADGTAWAWGGTGAGEIGDGTDVIRGSPVSMIGGHSFQDLVTISSHTMGLKSDGSVWACGGPVFGAVAAVDPRSPFQVSQISFSEMAQGQTHNVMLASDGTVWATGLNDSGQIGDGTVADRSSPDIVIGTRQVCPKFSKLAGGLYHSIGIATDGTAWGWGLNQNGALGIGTNGSTFASPIRIVGASNEFVAGSFIAISGEADASILLRSDGRAFATGRGDVGGLGDNTLTSKSVVYSVTGEHSFIAISGGNNGNHALGLQADGGVWTWGYNAFGQLGVGDFANRSTPSLVSGGHSFSSASAGTLTSVALKADGTAWTWGFNGNGELGIQSGVPHSSIPVSVHGNHSFVQASACDRMVAALKADGTAWAWGINFHGQLGDNTNTDKSSPVSVVGAHSFVSISGGLNFCVGFKADGSAWAWGLNSSNELGDGTVVAKSSPVSVIGGISFASVSAGNSFTLGLTSDGLTWGWGANNAGQLGPSQRGANASSPVLMFGQVAPHSFVHVTAALVTSGALKSNGEAWMWGSNLEGGLGDGTATARSSPVSVLGAHSFVVLATADRNSLALKADGTAWAWGRNGEGELGDGTIANKSSPVSVLGAHSFIKVALGQDHALALKADGTCWAWGLDGQGQLGDHSLTNKSSPVSTFGGHSFIKVAAGVFHSAGLKADGSVWTWGTNSQGGLGQGVTGTISFPGVVYGNVQLHSMKTVVASEDNTGAIRGDGTLWTWGRWDLGALGNNTTVDVASPTSVVGGHSAAAMASTGDHFLILKADGTCWSWGLNTQFELGDGTTTSRSSPISVIGNHSFVGIAGGSVHSMALKADGTAWGWGSNAFGECGNNSTDFTGRSSPTSVAGNHSFVQVSAGVNYSSGLKADGTCWTWGRGDSAQLGNNNTVVKSSPVSVVGNHSFVQISAGYTHVAAIKADGTAWAWGRGNEGELGDGTNVSKSSPVSVLGGHSFVEIRAGNDGTVAKKADGSAWVWGNGEITPDVANKSSPVQVALFSAGVSYSTISLGGLHVEALRLDGSVFAWGDGAHLKIGYGDQGNTVSTPLAVNTTLGLWSFSDIACGQFHTLALLSDGRAMTWGSNTRFQLGEKPFPPHADNRPNRSSPILVCTNAKFKSIAGGYQRSSALGKDDGTLFIWGDIEEIGGTFELHGIDKTFN